MEGFFQHPYKVRHLGVYKFFCFTVNNDFNSVWFNPIFHRELLLLRDLIKIPSSSLIQIGSLQGSLISFIKVTFKVFVELVDQIVCLFSYTPWLIGECFIVLQELSIVNA
jgi:hypothetical protein